MKITHSQFIKRAEEIHGTKYDYSNLPKYLGSVDKIELYCKIHSKIFFQRITNHLNGQSGCKECSLSSKKINRLSKDEFVKNAIKIHKNKYNYDNSNYINNQTKVQIKCNKCKEIFEMTPANHTHKTKPQGCRECYGNKKWNSEKFILIAQKKHSVMTPLYDYSKANFISLSKHVLIICKTHGEFKQRPQKHINGQGCPKCAVEFVSKKNRLTKEQFIEKSVLVHGDIYDYSEVFYENNSTHVVINCLYHGPFKQIPSSHLGGSGCPKCKMSHGEQKISNYLEKKNIKYERQYKINTKGIKNRYQYDFMFIHNNTKFLVEFNGEQHYKPVKWNKGDDNSEYRFKEIQKRDNIKKKLALTNSYQLIIIRHDDKPLTQKLDEVLKSI